MSSSRMIRCINGHVFDAAAHDACPNCGWTEPGKAVPVASVSTGGAASETGSGPIPPISNRNLMMIGAAAFVAIALGVGSYVFLKSTPVPDPIVIVPDKLAEKTPDKGPEKVTERTAEKVAEKAPDKVVEKKVEPQPETKVVPPAPPNAKGLSKFDALEPLTQGAQTAAATKLGLSPFATETALVTRATKLAEQYPVKLEALRLLVPFVKNNQPQALEVAGDANLDGNDVEKNEMIALDYLTRAANQGATRARIYLAEMLRLGRGTPKDQKAATDLYVLVSRADSKMSEQIIPLIAAIKIKVDGNGPTATDLQKAYESSNWEVSLKVAHELADVQIAKGYHILGLLSLNGFGVPKDQAVAIDWFKKATTIGYSPASESLSLIAKSPPTGSGNLVEAMVWLEIGFLQSENKDRAIYFTDKISEQAGLLDRNQWAAIKTLFADLAIPGPG